MADIKIDQNALNVSADALKGRIGKSISISLTDSCDAIAKMAKQFAPVRTGKLRDSIKSNVSGGVGTVYSDATYSGYVENGTRYMAAHPFLRPAFDAEKKNVAERFSKEMSK